MQLNATKDEQANIRNYITNYITKCKHEDKGSIRRRSSTYNRARRRNIQKWKMQ